MRILLELNDLLEKVDVVEYMKTYDDLLEEMMAIVPELAGANKLIDHFHSHNIPLAICTGSDSEEFRRKTINYQHWMTKIPLRVLSGSDPEVRFGKPHPDPYLVTLRRFDIPAASPKNVRFQVF